MSHQNPQIESPPPPSGNDAIQPKAPDFVETPEVAPLVPEHEAFPIWLYLLCGFILFLVGSSFTGFVMFGGGMLDQGPGGPVASSASAAVEAPATPMDLGKKIYGNNCASCHDSTGSGSPGKYPPMVGSEYVLGSKLRLSAIVLKGIEGSLNVKGVNYSGNVMPAQEAVLTPEKMADLLTYIRGSWGNTAGPVSVDEVNAAKTKFAAQTASWTEADLLKITDPTDKK